MISHTHLSRRLCREWKRLEMEEWQATDFIKGIVRGLKLSNAIAMNLWEETKREPHPNPSGSRRSLFKTIVLAHHLLKLGEREKGIMVLEKVIDRAKGKERERQLL